MLLLHTELTDRIRDAIAERLMRQNLPVRLASLGAGPSGALLVGMKLTKDEFDRACEAGVRWIQALPAGVEHVLTAELAASPIILTTGGGTAARPIAEFVFARILESAKKLRLLDEMQASRTWNQVWLGELAGATLTIVGLGPIGRAVAELGRAFGMHLVGVRRRPEAGPGPCDEVIGPESLTSVLSRTEYLVLAAPLTDQTRGLIGARELAALRDQSLVVNVGRGELIDEAALVDELASGRIRAALDVFAEEPLSTTSPWWDVDGAVVSPHCSAFTTSLFEGLVDLVIDNVQRFVDGRPLRNVVDKASGYPLPNDLDSPGC
ncbi:MAG: D-2-hydroxyacid dehydrogenase [Actinomycetota bacterium]